MEQRSEETRPIVRRDRITITAAVAAYNEEAHIGRCILDLLAQEGLNGADIEIIVIDGRSTDRTIDIVRSFPEYGTKIKLLHNPRRLQVHGWNMALQEANGTYFAMILAHARYSPTYFASCLEVMQRTRADAVGGVQRTYGAGLLGKAVAWCMSSAAGVGNARYRYTETEEESDSVFSIFTRADILRSLGGYDERVPFDEDSDMNYRMRASGRRLIVSPRIGVQYVVRHSIKALCMQMYRYGYWRRFTQLKHPREVPLRVLVPPALVAALVLSLAPLPTRAWPLALIVPGLYAGFTVITALRSVRQIAMSAVLVPFILAVMHVSYGVGYWVSLAKLHSARRFA